MHACLILIAADYIVSTFLAQSDFMARFAPIGLRAPPKLLSGLDSSGIMVIITQSDLIATMGQRGFWDEQQRVSKLQEKKPVLKRMSESIPWESFRPFLDQGYSLTPAGLTPCWVTSRPASAVPSTSSTLGHLEK